MYIPHNASQQSQYPHSGGPHEVQIGIFSVFIFYKYYFGQNLKSKTQTFCQNGSFYQYLTRNNREVLYLRL